MQGNIKDLEVEESSEDEYEQSEDLQKTDTKPTKGGMFSLLKGLVGSIRVFGSGC